jgi:hypothetical protein
MTKKKYGSDRLPRLASLHIAFTRIFFSDVKAVRITVNNYGTAILLLSPSELQAFEGALTAAAAGTLPLPATLKLGSPESNWIKLYFDSPTELRYAIGYDDATPLILQATVSAAALSRLADGVQQALQAREGTVDWTVDGTGTGAPVPRRRR